MNYCRDVSVGIGTPQELDSPGSEAGCKPVCVCSPYNGTDLLANVDPMKTAFYPSHS